MRIELSHSYLARATSSPRVLQVAGMFGLGLDDAQRVAVLPPVALDLRGGRIVFITGPSGSGKSTLLRLLGQAAGERGCRVLDLASVAPRPELALVDQFASLDLPAALALLSLAGLGDAFVLLRTPGQLSDGQRCRLQLALGLALASEACGTAPADGEPRVLLLADEFGATLDRLTAAVIAAGLRRWMHRPECAGLCLALATTHDDLLEPLQPDVLVDKGFGAEVEVLARSDEPAGSSAGRALRLPPSAV